jgi:hypothetical protein
MYFLVNGDGRWLRWQSNKRNGKKIETKKRKGAFFVLSEIKLNLK